MSDSTLLIDSNVWSHWLLGTPTVRAQVQTQMKALRRKYASPSLAISRLSMIEVQVGCLTQQPNPSTQAQSWSEFERLLQDFQIQVVEVNAEIGNTSAKWRAESVGRVVKARLLNHEIPSAAPSSKLKTLDALIAASCLAFDPPAILFTQNLKDFEFSVNGKKHNLGDLTIEPLILIE